MRPEFQVCSYQDEVHFVVAFTTPGCVGVEIDAKLTRDEARALAGALLREADLAEPLKEGGRVRALIKEAIAESVR